MVTRKPFETQPGVHETHEQSKFGRDGKGEAGRWIWRTEEVSERRVRRRLNVETEAVVHDLRRKEVDVARVGGD